MNPVPHALLSAITHNGQAAVKLGLMQSNQAPGSALLRTFSMAFNLFSMHESGRDEVAGKTVPREGFRLPVPPP